MCTVCKLASNKLAECFICNSQSLADTLFAIVQGCRLQKGGPRTSACAELYVLLFCMLCASPAQQGPFVERL